MVLQQCALNSDATVEQPACQKGYTLHLSHYEIALNLFIVVMAISFQKEL